MLVLHYLVLIAHNVLHLSARNLQIITSLNYNLSLSNDIVATGGAFSVSAENVNRKYKNYLNVSVVHLYNASQRSCDDVGSQSAQIISKYFYQNTSSDTCYALVTSPCNDVSAITSLSKGMDLLLFYNTLSKNDFLDQRDGPSNAIAIGGTNRGYTRITLRLLAYFKWYHATILVEAESIVPFYKNIGSLLLQNSKEGKLPFALEQYVFVRSETRKYINLAKERSRVFILLTTGSTAAQLLKAADTYGIANGEYVFINLQPLQGETYGLASQFSLTETEMNSTAVATVFQSLIFIAYHPVSREVRELSSAIAKRTNLLYNTTYKAGVEPLDSFPVQASYDIVELFAAVVNESNTNHGRPNCSGFDLARRVSNKTFDLSTGHMYVNPGQARNLDVDIFGFNVSTRSMQLVGGYDWSEIRLNWNYENNITWPTPDKQPPRDIPVCGFSGIDGVCQAEAASSTTNIASAIVICVILLMALIMLTRWYCAKLNKPADLDTSDWWLLASDRLSLAFRVSSCMTIQASRLRFDLRKKFRRSFAKN